MTMRAAAASSGKATILAHSESTVTYGPSSVTETDLFNFNVSGGVCVAGDLLRLTAHGDQLNNSGVGTNNTVWKAYLGATNWATTPNAGIANNANASFWMAQYFIQIVTTATERAWASLSAGNTTANTWQAANTTTAYPYIGTTTSLSIDTASAFAVRLTATHSVNGASTQTRLFGYVLERITN